MRNYLFKIILSIISILLIVACSKNEKPIKKPRKVSNIKIEDKELKIWQQEIKKAPYKIKTNLKNPFITPAFMSKSFALEPTVSIKLVGIVEKNGKRIALVQDNNNLGYFVKAGTQIGKIKILTIGKNYIIISQKIVNDYGEVKIVRKVLVLKKE